MNELIIQNHDFNIYRNRIKELKEFSEKEESELQIQKVKTNDGIFGWNEHKVTGSEANQMIESINSNLIDLNEKNNKTIKEFGEVYDVLELLDKYYLSCIIGSIKALEKTNNDIQCQQKELNNHNNQIKLQQSKICNHQEEIDKILDGNKKYIAVLNAFKERIENIEHITEIGSMWDELNYVSSQLSEHLNDIDEMWNLIDEAKEDILYINTALSERIEANQITITELTAYIEKLKNIEHLNELDSIWANVQNNTQNLIKLETTFDENKEALEQEIHEYGSQITGLQNDNKKLSEKIDDNQNTLIAKINKSHDHINEIKTNLSKSISENYTEISKLNDYANNLKKIEHLNELDSTWENVQNNTQNLTKLEITFDENKEALEKEIHEYSSQIIGLQDENKKLSEKIDDNQNTLIAKINDTNNVVKETMQNVSRKLKYAYILAGSATGLAVIEMIIIFARIL